METQGMLKLKSLTNSYLFQNGFDSALSSVFERPPELDLDNLGGRLTESVRWDSCFRPKLSNVSMEGKKRFLIKNRLME